MINHITKNCSLEYLNQNIKNIKTINSNCTSLGKITLIPLHVIKSAYYLTAGIILSTIIFVLDIFFLKIFFNSYIKVIAFFKNAFIKR